MPERITYEYDAPEDDTVVVDRGGGSSLGVVLGILVVLLILAAVWWFALGPGASNYVAPSGGGTDNGPTINSNPGGGQPYSS